MSPRDARSYLVGERSHLARHAVGVELFMGERRRCNAIGGVRVRVLVRVGRGRWVVGRGPWPVGADPKAALVIALLRRIAYNLLALFRSVTLRSEHSRSTPWKQVMRWVELALATATHDDVAGLRNRYAPAAATS